MNNCWRFTQADWRAIMEDFRQKARDTNNYDRIRFSEWKSLMTAINIEMNYEKDTEAFYIKCFDENGDCVAVYLFGVDETTASGKRQFGDYLATYIVHIPEEDEISLAINYDTATTAATNYNGHTNTATWNPGGMIINSSDLTTSYAINAYGVIENKSEIKENKTMENKIFNFDFGPIKGDSVRMSMYGLAIKNKDGNYVAWDKVNENIMNVDILNFSGDGLMYKMPVAIKDIKDGDIVIHNRVPMFVLEVFEKSLDVIDIYSGERKSIIPAKSPFNFDFCTKIISILDTDLVATSSPSEDNPFGSLWMLMLLSGSMDNDSNLLPLMLMTNRDSIDPIMLMCLINNKNTDNNLLPLMLMMNGGKFGC